MLTITTSAAGPTLVVGSAFAYAEAALPTQIDPGYVIAGIILVFLLSVFILRHEARRIFSIIDTVPQLTNDIHGIKDDVGDIKDTVKNLIPWKEQVEGRLKLMEFRLDARDQK